MDRDWLHAVRGVREHLADRQARHQRRVTRQQRQLPLGARDHEARDVVALEDGAIGGDDGKLERHGAISLSSTYSPTPATSDAFSTACSTAPNHVERLLRQIVVLALEDRLEAADRVGNRYVLAGAAGELLGDEHGL